MALVVIDSQVVERVLWMKTKQSGGTGIEHMSICIPKDRVTIAPLSLQQFLLISVFIVAKLTLL